MGYWINEVLWNVSKQSEWKESDNGQPKNIWSSVLRPLINISWDNQMFTKL